MSIRYRFWLLICATVLVTVGLPFNVPAQENGEFRELAIPINVSIVTGESFVILTGKSNGASTVKCAPGPFEFEHNAVVIDPGGGSATQRTEVVVFHSAEEPARPGTRFRISGDGAPCNADYKLYSGRVE